MAPASFCMFEEVGLTKKYFCTFWGFGGAENTKKEYFLLQKVPLLYLPFKVALNTLEHLNTSRGHHIIASYNI